METVFTKLNIDWNAEPNSPNPQVTWSNTDLKLEFYMNPYQFPQFNEDDIGIITFTDCSRYRLGPTNDEGWHLGQCRFSKIAPTWGEFYEILGDLKLDQNPNDWVIKSTNKNVEKHFLFYFRDNTFECDASGWALEIKKFLTS